MPEKSTQTFDFRRIEEPYGEAYTVFVDGEFIGTVRNVNSAQWAWTDATMSKHGYRRSRESAAQACHSYWSAV